jgi:hypothetical protein
MQHSLILPARTETFEQLVVTARTYFQSSTNTSSSAAATSQRVFYADGGEEKHCSHCFAESGRKLPHASANCRNNKRRQNQEAGSNKRSAPDSDDREVTCYRCNDKGHYSSNCTTPLLLEDVEAEINVAEVVVAVEEVAHIICEFLTKERVEILNTQKKLWQPQYPLPQPHLHQVMCSLQSLHFFLGFYRAILFCCVIVAPIGGFITLDALPTALISAKLFTLWLLTTSPCTRRTELA